MVRLRDADAQIADYRDEFSALCHTLSVGSEGRPEMTASDWRKRVDQGIDFLARPLLARIEATDKELAKRSRMLDICTQNCSDWIGKWHAEQERAERAESELARLREYVASLAASAPAPPVVEVAWDVCSRVHDYAAEGQDTLVARNWLHAWQRELGPTLGMVTREQVEAAYREGLRDSNQLEWVDDQYVAGNWLNSAARKRMESGR